MKVMEVRFDVELISADVLARYMRFRKLTVRGLADKVNKPKARSTIGHLRSGRRKTCSPELAVAIEAALEAPPGSLFVAKVSTVSRVKGPVAA